MTTALDTIKRSMRMLGVYSIGEEPGPSEAQDALTALNALVQSFSNTQMVYAKTLDSITLSATVAAYTVGPSGGTVTTRPVRVLDDSYVDFQGVSYPVVLLTLQEYNDIALKTQPGIPMGIWVQPDMPNITVTAWPVPDQTMTLKLWSDKLVTSFPALTTTVTLPPGYEDALAYLLAEAIAPEYEVSLTKEVAQGVSRSRRLLKRANMQVPKQRLDIPAGIYGVANWRTGV